MILLRATGDLLRVITGSGGASIECHVSAIETDNSTPPVVQDLPRVNTAAITTATTTTILDCTTANRRRRVLYASIRNDHASATETVEVVHSDGTTVETIVRCTLLAGESLIYNGAGTWLHYDTNAALYPSVGNAATQAEMEAGTATNKYVTPQGVNWHPGVAKCWGKAVGAGTSLTVNWNISGITDTATGRLGVTIGTDFSSANYAIDAQIERGVTTLGVADVEQCAIRNASPAAGSFEIESYDHTATTLAADDPANYFWACFGDQ